MVGTERLHSSGNALIKIGPSRIYHMAFMAVLGFVWYGSPSGFLYTVLLAVMLKVRHPAPRVMEPLGDGRVVVAIITLDRFRAFLLAVPYRDYVRSESENQSVLQKQFVTIQIEYISRDASATSPHLIAARGDH